MFSKSCPCYKDELAGDAYTEKNTVRLLPQLGLTKSWKIRNRQKNEIEENTKSFKI
jgi:hypothetical protein